MLTIEQITGHDHDHVSMVEDTEPHMFLHPETVAAFLAMRSAAADAGLDLSIASAFRDFDRQRLIWNRKFAGELPLYNDRGEQLVPQQLTTGEKIQAILTWSALPGASRHHWGTDFDVYDARPFAVLDTEVKLQLIPTEYAEGGPCYALHQWLVQHAAAFGFFFPYARYNGGIAAEPWHLSYRPVAEQAQLLLTTAVLERTLQTADIAGKDYLLAQLPEIKEQYIDNICSPEPRGSDLWFG